MPAAGDGVVIRFGRPQTREAFLCTAATREIGPRPPDRLKTQDRSGSVPVQDLSDIAASFSQLPGARTTDARLDVEMTR